MTRKNLKGGLEVEGNTRPDITIGRAEPSTYLAKIERPDLGNRAEWVKAAHKRGVPFRDLIKGSGLKTRTVLTLCGLNPDEERRLVEELDEFRNNLLNFRD